MIHFLTIRIGRIATALAILAITAATSFASTALPSSAVDVPIASKKSVETAVLAGAVSEA